MSSRIFIEDDGDETILVNINEETIGSFDHDEFGWAGMEAVIKAVEAIADAFGIPITNNQDIV